MFEKEAEKHADGIYHYKINVSDYGEDGIINYRYSDVKEAYQKGAEFGYNKANEWQYVSEKGTPKKEGHYLVCLRNKDKDIFDCWIYYDKDVGWYSIKVRMIDIYAWKEIVLPELPKESE